MKTNTNINRPLALAGLANIFIGLLHFSILLIGSHAYAYFGAPASFVQHPHSITTIVSMLILTGFFFIIGLYAFCGTRLLKRWVFTKTVLVSIGLIYTLRGAVIMLYPFPDLTQKIMAALPTFLKQTRSMQTHDWLFSLIALIIGITYLYGANRLKQSGQ